jgi:hypothetical protein
MTEHDHDFHNAVWGQCPDDRQLVRSRSSQRDQPAPATIDSPRFNSPACSGVKVLSFPRCLEAVGMDVLASDRRSPLGYSHGRPAARSYDCVAKALRSQHCKSRRTEEAQSRSPMGRAWASLSIRRSSPRRGEWKAKVRDRNLAAPFMPHARRRSSPDCARFPFQNSLAPSLRILVSRGD